MTQQYKLPPLPEWSKMDNLAGLVPSEIRQCLNEHAAAAIELDRQGRGEPVAWGIFYQGVMQQGWGYNEEAANAIAAEEYPEVKVAVKPLYLAPQSAKPVKESSETEALKIIGYYADLRIMASQGRLSKREVHDAWEDIKALLARYGKPAQPSVPAGKQALTFQQWWSAGGHKIVSAQADRSGWKGSAEAGYIAGLLSSAATTKPANGQAQQDAEKVDAKPVGYFQNVNSANGLPPQYEQVSAVAKSDDDVFPLYRAPVAAQPDPAMAGDDRIGFEAWLRGHWSGGYSCPKKPNGEYAHSEAQSLWLAWQSARKRVQPASGKGVK